MVGKDKIEVIDLSDEEIGSIEERLSQFDRAHIGYALEGSASVGVRANGRLVAGADGCMTAYRIFYVSTVFVDEEYRGRGIGRALMYELERRAREMGANLIRLDTFDFQGKGFYEALGYECVGSYASPTDGFSEYFYLKRL